MLADPPRPVLADTLHAIKDLSLRIGFVSEPHDRDVNWVQSVALASLDHGHLRGMLESYQARGYAPNPRVGAAVLMLRFGWIGGFAIGPYLARARVPFLRDYGLFFPNAGEKGPPRLWFRDAQFVGRPDDPLSGTPEWMESVPQDLLRRRLLESLLELTEPLVAALHAWSRLSRHALWAMGTSTWGSQFLAAARALGDPERGMLEARATCMLDPEIKRAAPAFYELQSGGVSRYCQRRSACCLYFKVTERDFCASCPIIPEAERLQRQRAWVAKQIPHPP